MHDLDRTQLETRGPWSEEEAYESESIMGELITESTPGSGYALGRAIPDDPDYSKHVPIEYRLDAKAIVGGFIVDMQKDDLNVRQQMISAGMKAIGKASRPFEAARKLAVIPLMPAAMGYQGAAEVRAVAAAATGFSQGVVMGADGRSWSLAKDYFGRKFFEDPALPGSAKIDATNFYAGLVAGFLQGRKLSKNQRAIFWHDLGHRMGDQSARGPSERWGRPQWIDWYFAAAGRFWQDHLVEHTRGGFKVFKDAVDWWRKF